MDNPSYHREIMCHHYDSTFHFYFGSEVSESTCSTIPFHSSPSHLAVSVILGLNPGRKMPSSLNCSISYRIVLLEQVVVPKRFP